MADRAKFSVKKRDVVGKRVRHLRKSGVVPGVVYGADHQPENIQVEELKIERLISETGFSAPIDLDFGDKKHLAILKNIDRDPVTGVLRNVEFQTVSANETIDAEIQINLINKEESPAAKAGLIIMKVLDVVEVRALPRDMIQEIEVSALDLAEKGDHITLGDLKLPTGVEFTDKEVDLEQVVANVYDAEELAAANESAGGDAEDISEVEAENGGEADAEADAEGEEKADEATETAEEK